MPRLIDADALPKYTGYALSAVEVAKAVENAPTIDAVQVVRCGECRYWKKQEVGGTCELNIRLSASGNWFCADGERKQE